MNNWRLLLLALAAVFQPITSFTERNLVDGRQNCCDQLSSPLRDTRSSFHGTHRLQKSATAALRHLYDRDEIQQDRRNDIRHQASVYNLPITERRLLDVQARGLRHSVIANGYETRLKRYSTEQNRIRSPKTEHLTDGVVDSTSRTHAAQERHSGRSADTSRGRTLRDDHRTERNERKSKNLFNSQRGIPGQQIRSGEVRFNLYKNARHVFRQSTRYSLPQSMNEESRIGAAKNINNRVMRGLYESSVRADSRRNIDNRRERQLERINEQRRLLSEHTPIVRRIRDIRIRMNIREVTPESLFSERSGLRQEQRGNRRDSRQHNTENTDQNTAQRMTREFRTMSKINNRSERNVYGAGLVHSSYEISEKPGHRLTRKIHRVQRNNYEFRVIGITIKNGVDSRRENRNNERKIPNNLLERIQMVQTNFRDFRINNVISRNGRDIDSTRAIRYNTRPSRETGYLVREHSDQRYSRDIIPMQQRNVRELRILNTLSESDVAGQRQIENNVKSLTETRREIRDLRDHRLRNGRIQMSRRQNRDSRIINTLNERGLEIRLEGKLSTEIRDEVRQVDRRDIRETRIITNGNVREIESKEEIRYNERLARKVRDDQFTRESRGKSRVSSRITASEERDNSVTNRGIRSADSRNFRQIRTEPKLDRSVEQQNELFRSRVEHTDKIENREREAIEARSRNVALTRNRDNVNRAMVGKVNPENDSIVGNWQYVLYTLQAAYLCSLFMQILTQTRSEKPHKMNLHWLRVSSDYNPIKVD